VALTRNEGTLPSPSVRWDALRVDIATPELEAKLAASFASAPEGLSLSVAQVPAMVGSPSEYGDGVFELTIENRSRAPIEVPGLSTRGKDVLWADALEVRHEGLTSTLPRPAIAGPSAPLVLAPGAKVTTTLDVKPFGIKRPVGGDRMSYSFGIGPLRTTSWFYYVHTFHGPLMGKTGKIAKP
jgi:hypothetical protein